MVNSFGTFWFKFDCYFYLFLLNCNHNSDIDAVFYVHCLLLTHWENRHKIKQCLEQCTWFLFIFSFLENTNFYKKHMNRIANKLRNPFTVNDDLMSWLSWTDLNLSLKISLLPFFTLLAAKDTEKWRKNKSNSNCEQTLLETCTGYDLQNSNESEFEFIFSFNPTVAKLSSVYLLFFFFTGFFSTVSFQHLTISVSYIHLFFQRFVIVHDSQN